jgi:Lhr-like helicase
MAGATGEQYLRSTRDERMKIPGNPSRLFLIIQAIMSLALPQLWAKSKVARRVLRSAYFSDVRRPSISEIVRMADLPLEDVGQALTELEAKGLVQSKDYEGTMRWRVRTVGKAFLAAEQNEAAKGREN